VHDGLASLAVLVLLACRSWLDSLGVLVGQGG